MTNVKMCFMLCFDITGMSGPVLWLQNRLIKTAEDREKDGERQNFILAHL